MTFQFFPSVDRVINLATISSITFETDPEVRASIKLVAETDLLHLSAADTSELLKLVPIDPAGITKSTKQDSLAKGSDILNKVLADKRKAAQLRNWKGFGA